MSTNQKQDNRMVRTDVKIRADWVDELRKDLEEDIWESALQWVNDSTSCAKLSIIKFKSPHHIHYSKARLAKVYPNTDASCDRCRNTPADSTHMFWSSPALATYWSTIFKMLSEALNINLQTNVAVAIFGTTDRRHTTLRKSYKNIIAFTHIEEYYCIGNRKNPSKVSLWFSGLTHFIQLETIKYTLRGSRDKFISVWEPILTHLGKLKTLPS